MLPSENWPQTAKQEGTKTIAERSMEIAELIESNVKMKQENTKLVEEMDIIETMSEAEKVCDTVVKEA